MNDFRSRCRILLALGIAMVPGVISMTGCQGLDYSARGEGTGIQIVGAVIVLARYHATPQQKAVAEKQAKQIFLAAAKPVYEERRAAVEAESRKKLSTVERGHAKRIASASKTGTASGADAGASVAPLQARQQQEIEKLKSEAAASLVAVDTAWRSLGGTVAKPVKPAEPRASPPAGVPTASTRDREIMIASASARLAPYIAVSVPAQGLGVEKGGKAMVMLFDTLKQQLSSEDVLVLDRKPASGKDTRVDGLMARYAGN